MKTYNEFYEAKRKLTDEIIECLLIHLGDKRMVIEDPFEDMSGNEIQAISKDGVYFNCEDPETDGDIYPLDELSIDDIYYLLYIVENQGKR